MAQPAAARGRQTGPNGQTGKFAECPTCIAPTYACDHRYRVPKVPTAWALMQVDYLPEQDVFYCELYPGTRPQVRSFKELCVKPFLSTNDFLLKPRRSEVDNTIIGLEHADTAMEVHGWQKVVADTAPDMIDRAQLANDNAIREGPEPGEVDFKQKFVFSRVWTRNSDNVESDNLEARRWTENGEPLRMVNGKNYDRCPNHLVYETAQFPLVDTTHDAVQAQLDLLYNPAETPTGWVPITASFYRDGTDDSVFGRPFSPKDDPICISAHSEHLHAIPEWNMDRWHDLQATSLIDSKFYFLLHPRFKREGQNTKVVSYTTKTGILVVEGWCNVLQWLITNANSNQPLELKARRYWHSDRGHVLQLAPMDDHGAGPQWKTIRDTEKTGVDVTNHWQ